MNFVARTFLASSNCVSITISFTLSVHCITGEDLPVRSLSMFARIPAEISSLLATSAYSSSSNSPSTTFLSLKPHCLCYYLNSLSKYFVFSTNPEQIAMEHILELIFCTISYLLVLIIALRTNSGITRSAISFWTASAVFNSGVLLVALQIILPSSLITQMSIVRRLMV